MTDEAHKAAERQIGRSELYYHHTPLTLRDKNGLCHYPLVVAGGENASDFVTLLRHLPHLFEDQSDLAATLSSLTLIIAEQQAQIENLTRKLEDVLHTTVAIKAADEMNTALFRLAAEGCDITRPEMKIRISATTSINERRSSKDKKNIKSSKGKKMEISAELSGLAKKLASLRVSGALETKLESDIARALEQSQAKSQTNEFAGDVTLKFDSIAGSPLAKAKAKGTRTADSDLVRSTSSKSRANIARGKPR